MYNAKVFGKVNNMFFTIDQVIEMLHILGYEIYENDVWALAYTLSTLEHNNFDDLYKDFIAERQMVYDE